MEEEEKEEEVASLESGMSGEGGRKGSSIFHGGFTFDTPPPADALMHHTTSWVGLVTAATGGWL